MATPACARIKIRYAAAAAAEQARERLYQDEVQRGQERLARRLHVYFCADCDAYHIGHRGGGPKTLARWRPIPKKRNPE